MSKFKLQRTQELTRTQHEDGKQDAWNGHAQVASQAMTVSGTGCANARDDKRTGSPTENHSFTARKPIQWKNSRTSSFENKVEVQDITRKVQGHELRDKTNLEWNTELIEAMEVEHVMSQAAQDLNDGETRHESWKAQAQEHEYLLERARTPVHQETTRKLNSQTSRAEEVCLKNACMNDVHMTSPHDNHDHDHDHDHVHDTTTKGWRFGGSSPWMSHHPSGSRQGHPRYTGAVTTEGRGWPDQRPTGRSHAQ